MTQNDYTPLEALEQAPANGGKPKQLIMLLHGLGANGADLMGLAPVLAPLFPDAIFVSPNAPFPCDIAPFGYQWFSMQDRHEAVLLDGIRKAAPILEATVAYYHQRYDIRAANTVLLGFSQGCMMSLHVGLRMAETVAGVVGFSGALVGESSLAADIVARPPICLVHGDADPVVPFERLAEAERVLAEHGMNVEAHARPHLQHGIDEDGLRIAAEFMQRVLDKALVESS